MISFGMIVKDGMPFVKYSLQCIYPLNCEIIIIDGGSTDGTLEYIKDLKDEDNKIALIEGKWKDKTEQCNEYMRRAKGAWVWQLDSDEVYKKNDLTNTIEFLGTTTENVLCIPIINFFRNLSTIVVDGLWSTPPVRIFRHEKGNLYTGHRPPTVKRSNGKILKSLGYTLYTAIIYHYSHIGIDRVRKKAQYYSENLKAHPIYSRYTEWFEKVYMSNQQTNLHITGGGTARKFESTHPEVIEEALKRNELSEFLKKE